MSKLLKYIRVGLIVALIAAFLFLAHAVIYYAVAVLWPDLFVLYGNALLGALYVLGVSFIAGSLLAARYNNILTRLLYLVAAVWLGTFLYLFMAGMLYVIIGWSAWAIGYQIPVILGRLLFEAAIVAAIYGLFHARQIKVKNVSIAPAGLPDSWVGRKAVFLSDMHLGQIHTREFARKVWSTVDRLRPDLIMIGGDLYDGVKVDEEAVIAPLKNWNPALGVYFVTGNHEEFSSSAHFIQAIKKIGIRVLDNEIVDIDGLQLIGMTDHDSIDEAKLKKTLDDLKIDRNKPSIFLKHQPSGLAIAEAAGVSLQLSGHTHRAQQWPLAIFTRWIFKGYDYGLKQFGKMHVYTSSGVGTWGPPMRVGSDSEIVLLSFE